MSPIPGEDEAWWKERYGKDHLPVMWEYEINNQAGFKEHLDDHADHRLRLLKRGKRKGG